MSVVRWLRRVHRRVREYVLLDADRLLVAGVVLVGVFAVVSLPPIAGALADWGATRTATLFGGLVGGNLTLVTVVLSINQLVLSRELHTPEEIGGEIDAAVEYRDGVQTAVAESGIEERVTPGDLAQFLALLLASARDSVERFEAATEGIEPPERRRAAAGLAELLLSRIDEMRGLLTESDVDLFTALSTVLRYDLAEAFNRGRWLAGPHGPEVGEEATAALEEVQQHVRYLESARQYAKTLYVQSELASFSRLLLYVGLVSIFSSVLMVGLARPPAGLPAGPTIRAAVVLGFAPLAVLLAYVLRVATVAQRTAAFVPFGTPG